MKKLDSPTPSNFFNPEELEGRFEMRTWIRVEYPPDCECPEAPAPTGPTA